MTEKLEAPRLDIIDAKAPKAFTPDVASALRIERGGDLLKPYPEALKQFEALSQSLASATQIGRNPILTGDAGALKTTALLNTITKVFFKVFEVIAWAGIAGSIALLFLAIMGFIPH